MAAQVRIDQDGFELWTGKERIGGRRHLDAQAVQALEEYAARYRVLIETVANAGGLLALGRVLYHWLDGESGALAQLRERAEPPLRLELEGPRQPSQAEWALLRAPWELLADDAGYLVQDALLQFGPVRRLGRVQSPAPLDDHRLGLAFMAAAPRGERVLDYEAEESAILDAVGDRNLDLLVEESGSAPILGERLAELRLLAAHISCHGLNAWRPPDAPQAPPRPVLLLENHESDPDPTEAGALIDALRPRPPRLLFLSACLSAAAADADAGANAAQGGANEPLAHSLATALVSGGLPAVIGWDGSVADRAATALARALYDGLARRQDLADALATARRGLLGAGDEALRRDWHLARLWLGPHGGGPPVAGRRKRSLLPATHGQKEFLGKQQVPVASHEMFVGRRRKLQTALRILRGGEHAGVLLHGMGWAVWANRAWPRASPTACARTWPWPCSTRTTAPSTCSTSSKRHSAPTRLRVSCCARAAAR